MLESDLNRAGSAPVATTAAGAQPSLTELVTGIVDDAQTLFKQQVQMLKAEFNEDLNRTKRAMQFAGIGVSMLTVGGLALVTALAHMLHEQWGFSLTASWGIIGGLFLAVGVILGMVAKNLFESFNPLPDKTFNALGENLSWNKNPK